MWIKLSILLLFSAATVQAQVLVDCYREAFADQSKCEARGCVWKQLGDEISAASAPWCTYPEGYGYEHDGSTVIDTPLGYILPLTRKNQPSMYGSASPDVNNVYLSVEFWAENILRLKFYDPNVARYEVPIEISPPSARAATTDYFVTHTSNPQFGIAVVRNSTGTTVFNTQLPGFVFSDQFLTLTTTLPSSNVYGFGEHNHHYLRHDLNWEDWTMFSRDTGTQTPDNLYGVQPFYMNVENDGNANGVFFLNSNAMEIELQPNPALTYWTIGGILDFYIFLGPTPEQVAQQYSQLVGHQYMPPYWSLGFQLSRWGYTDTNEMRSVIQNMRDAQIPYDVQYTDIDYMDGYKDFTLSKTTFADLPLVIQDLHDHGQRYVPIIDAAIADFGSDYYAYTQGLAYDIFIKAANGSNLEGNVWPGNVHYPDFTNEKALTYWTEQCLYLYNNLSVEYDGIWIDMNEPSSFVPGSTTSCEHNHWNYPPYCPPVLGSPPEGKLFDKTICMDAKQIGGLQYDIHSLFGYTMSKTTFNSLVSGFPQRRPFVFTRSQYAGTAPYAHHWLGDNESTFLQLRDSIVGIQEYNIFGIPFVGADICGFNKNTTVELCIRWMQLGSFYSFARNHNSQGQIAQDPPSLGEQVVNASVKVLNERYRLLPHLYTLLYQAHTTGSTVIRPLFFEFPSDPQTWNVSFQFLWGSGLLISPVVYEGDTSVVAYFPAAKWYDYYTGNNVNGVEATSITLDAPLDGNIPLHVRGGTIIPTQQPAVTTTISRENPMGLIVAVDDQGKAGGLLYWDDGITYQADVKGLFNQFEFSFDQDTLNIIVLKNGLVMSTPLDNIVVYGLAAGATVSITVDGNALDSSKVQYNSALQVLTLSGLNLPLPSNHQIKITSN
ncbi:hypothetical protein CHUAL_007705 [Chamberlinius hualienensis]